MKERTNWFQPEVNPEHVGVYETRINRWCAASYQHWNGIFWAMFKPTPEDAYYARDLPSECRPTPEWRGLTEPAA